MENNFKNISDKDQKAPESLKNMVVSELDLIRDAMQLMGMFMGESFVAIGKILEDISPKTEKP